MASVVITGSTRGIGLSLAREFQARDHAVMMGGAGYAVGGGENA